MAEYIGRRIVPTHGGVWNETKEYEELVIVLDEESGDSYISRIPVPSGTALDDEEYWMLFSIYSEQIQEALDAIEETSEEMVAYVDKTAASLTEYVQETAEDLTEKVEAAEDLTESNTSSLTSRMDTIESRQDANVTASTDSDADYAAEVVDARVDHSGTEYASMGTHIRTMEEQFAGSHTMYLYPHGGLGGLVIDTDARTIQVTDTWILGVMENARYKFVPECDPLDFVSSDAYPMKGMVIIGYDAGTDTINIYNTEDFRALGEKGYYIASILGTKLYNAHIHPDVPVMYDGTTYSAGELFDAATASSIPANIQNYVVDYVEGYMPDYVAGTHSMYICNHHSPSFIINLDTDAKEGTVQLETSDGIVGVTENMEYVAFSNTEEVSINGALDCSMCIFGCDISSRTFNLYSTDEFQALGDNGYYIASLWGGRLYNAHIHPDVSITYNGTTYSAGQLFDTDSASYIPGNIQDYVQEHGADDTAGTHTMYLYPHGGLGKLVIDTDARTIQVTDTWILGVMENAKYKFVPECDAIEFASADAYPEKGMVIFGYDAETDTINVYNTTDFQALGENGYYIASLLNGKFYNAHIHPDVPITYNGTEYSAGDLFDTDSAKHIPANIEDFIQEFFQENVGDYVGSYIAGTHSMYICSHHSPSFIINLDTDAKEGTVQLETSDGIVGVTENREYVSFFNTEEVSVEGALDCSMCIFGCDISSKTFNLYSTAEFQALGDNGYYIASLWGGKLYNAHIHPDVSITYNGTTYSAGQLFDTNSASFIPGNIQDYVQDYVSGYVDEDGRGDIVSPSHWDCMEGRQFSMFYDCLSRHEDMKEMYRINNSMDLCRNEYCLNYTPASDDEDFDITIARLNKNTMTVAESKAVTVKVHHPLSTSLTKNVCICGDSLVDNAYLAQEVWDMLDEDGDCVINHIGTRGGTGYEHEGHGGWSWYTYITYESYNSRPNAFWDSDNGCLNFQKYCEDNGYDGIDYFLMGLGTNDVGLGSTTAKTEAQIQTIITRAKTFIDALLSEEYGYPNCKIGIGLPGPAAFYSSYASWSTAIFRNCINSLNLAYIEAFDNGAYHENVTCFAYGLRTDRMHAFPYTEAAVNDRFSETCITITETKAASSHPSSRGYQAWADGYYCQIRAWLTEDAEAEETEEAQG